MRAHFKESSVEDFMRSIFNHVYAILFSDFLFKSVYCEYLFDFVCVEVLRPSQPNGVLSSTVSLSNHTVTGQA